MENWPEDAIYGSLTLHSHFGELVEIWNNYSRLSRYMDSASINPVSATQGLTVIDFQNSRDMVDFLDMFDLHPFKISSMDNKTDTWWIQLRNSFSRDAFDRFDDILKIQRAKLVDINASWRNDPPHPGHVLPYSMRIFYSLKKTHESIAQARLELVNGSDGK